MCRLRQELWVLLPEGLPNDVHMQHHWRHTLTLHRGSVLLVLDHHLFTLPDDHRALFELLRQGVIVDTKLREQHLILDLGCTALQGGLGLGRSLVALLYQGPEHRVVLVVDVCVHLPPGQVVPHCRLIGVQHCPAVKHGGSQQGALRAHDGGPVPHVVGSEAGGEQRHDLGAAATVQLSFAMYHKAILVTLPKRNPDIRELPQNLLGALVHEVKRLLVIWLYKLV
mmetsp:Transcript_39579/g.88045  ORF Transcript_39579/g.88045 Transcript_39579/m.88045 type:complete len:225 (-) Transcript_39579:331-1005(-)